MPLKLTTGLAEARHLERRGLQVSLVFKLPVLVQKRLENTGA